jgi:hypothetical protein
VLTVAARCAAGAIGNSRQVEVQRGGAAGAPRPDRTRDPTRTGVRAARRPGTALPHHQLRAAPLAELLEQGRPVPRKGLMDEHRREPLGSESRARSPSLRERPNAATSVQPTPCSW